MKVAITGHRPNKLGNDYTLTSELLLKIKEEIVNTIQRPPIFQWFVLDDLQLISGMALGIDTLFAKIAIEQRIPFIAAVPFAGQESTWPERSRKTYNDILSSPLCTLKVVCSGAYSAHKMQVRNEWMVNNCNILIAVWDGTPGGTGNCVAYAEKVKKRIIRIDPKDFTS